VNDELLYQLLDPDSRKVYDLAFAAEQLTGLRETREEYLANIRFLKDRGFDFEPDPALLAQLDELTSWYQEWIKDSEDE
jgi:hypothetical protein